MAFESIPSICIPRAHISVTENLVEQTFDYMFGVGTVRDTDMLLREDYKTGELFWLIFVHFNAYVPSKDAANIVSCINNFKARILNGEQVRVEYDGVHFWKVYKQRASSPPDFENDDWEPIPANSDELENMFDKMLLTAPINCH
tara:strand:+ start:55771 stop:56202 length:432 start_codon:yes stop_codon:yes gene_type:complete